MSEIRVKTQKISENQANQKNLCSTKQSASPASPS